MPAPLASSHAIRHAAAGVLGTRALPLPALMGELAGCGLALGSDPEDRVAGALDGDGGFIELEAGRWISTASVLDATTWTTRVSSALAASDCLPEEPDLGLLGWWALDHPIEVAGQATGMLECVEFEDGTDGLGGPVGWLAGCEDAWVRVDIAGSRLAVEPLAQTPEPTPVQVAALQTVFDRIADHEMLASTIGDEQPVELVRADLDDLLWEALVANRDAFTSDPIAPLDYLLAAANLERADHFVTRTGTDPTALVRWKLRRKLAAIHHLDDEQVDAAEILLAVSFASIGESPELFGPPEEAPRAARLLAACLADADVARAFVGQHAELGTDPESLVGFARRLLEHLDDEVAAVGPRWLLGRSLDQLGDPIGAQAELELAVASGFEHPLALRDLAGFLADRGDAPAGLDLLRRTEVDGDDPFFLEIAGYALHRPPPTAGRNDLCPCGSGRKYKACHLGREPIPLIDRGPWLHAKARRYLRDNRHRLLAAEIAAEIGDHSGRDPGFLLSLLDSELVADIALCEAGVFDEFVAERDAILPDDEALLAARWALVSRTLFEVEWAQDDELALRDLRTGDHIVVTNTHSSEATRPGWLMLGRPLPIEDTWRAYSGFVRIPDSMRDGVLVGLDDPDPFEIAALIGHAFAPPQMSNTDGDPLVFHELTYRIPDPEQAARALAGGGLEDNGDGDFTLVRDSANQPNTLIMGMQLSGDALEVSVNSDRRATEARALVESLLPDAVLEDIDYRDVDEMLADSATDSCEERAASPADDPELAGVLDEFIRAREARWVDEPVPALGGLTPRQAAVDPIGHHELERLLASFDDAPRGRGVFDPDRLRELLNLP